MESSFNERFAEWLGRVSDEDAPPPSIVAYNIGLFETTDSYTAYLMGASGFSDENAEWTVWPGAEPEFSPVERYFPLPFKNTEKEWKDVLPIVIEATRAFLASPKGMSSYLSQAEAVTVGFDDGDLEQVK